jgi:hypothetical protein
LGSRLISENNSLHPSYTYPGLFEISQKIPFEDLDGTISIRIEDENGKFNLNSLVFQNGRLNEDAYASFVKLLKMLSLKRSVADAVVSWINPELKPAPADSRKAPKRGYLDSIDELLLIPGVDNDSYDKLLPYVTIYGSSYGSLQININGANINVIRSLSDNISPDMAEEVVRQREMLPLTSINSVRGFENPGVIPAGVNIIYSCNAFRVMATAESGGIKRMVECVLDSSGKNVLYWKEL